MTEPAHRGTGRRGSPVAVRSMSDPRPGWLLLDAVGLAVQGYELDHIERVTGFVSAHVAARLGDNQKRSPGQALFARGPLTDADDAAGRAE